MRESSLNIRLSANERTRLENAAAAEGRTVTAYVRFHALVAATAAHLAVNQKAARRTGEAIHHIDGDPHNNEVANLRRVPARKR